MQFAGDLHIVTGELMLDKIKLRPTFGNIFQHASNFINTLQLR